MLACPPTSHTAVAIPMSLRATISLALSSANLAQAVERIICAAHQDGWVSRAIIDDIGGKSCTIQSFGAGSYRVIEFRYTQRRAKSASDIRFGRWGAGADYLNCTRHVLIAPDRRLRCLVDGREVRALNKYIDWVAELLRAHTDK